MTAYNLGHFQEAIEEFEKAYEIRSEPIFLYNIAQSHRQNGNPQRAIFFYRRYVEADPSSKKRAEVEKRIADMQSELDAQREREAAAAAPPPVVAPQPLPPQTVPVFVPQPAVRQNNPVAAADASQGRGLRIGGIVAAGVGVAGAVTGVILVLHGNSLHDESIAAGSQFDSSKYDSAKTFRTMGWVAVGVGAAAVATGVTLYILGSRTGSEPSVSVAPVVAAGTGGAALFGRF
jgi:tetratricopeptide (TPR) repeat protein